MDKIIQIREGDQNTVNLVAQLTDAGLPSATAFYVGPNSRPERVTELLTSQGFSRRDAERFTTQIPTTGAGATIVTADIPYGAGGRACRLLEEQGPEPVVVISDREVREAAPFRLFGLPSLLGAS